jgi:hypothetical protein
MNATGEQAKRWSEQRSVAAVALNISLSSQKKNTRSIKESRSTFVNGMSNMED